ncbi:hypothetical protein [Microbispora bryophytorum]|uniref:Uncharacterized protein n=1 Tax=Microbispora bryophytorum TaxID=1460882 RepID=A0A8H9LDR2_9ACTN|nr:hypothetical protein [Microbispora bryophytorum]MBD3134705.1 hypothetical protein [Microbispora bryophytorum]TQS09015.1 hypothetical protein FLX07_07310 [Microbispora bryophytorum]GGO12721.1 hypothetical protein GCM10011574_31480 [Microbispora bryophytorum]
MRPAVGEPLRRCPSCGGWECGGAPDCPRCAELVDAIVEEGALAKRGARAEDLAVAIDGLASATG